VFADRDFDVVTMSITSSEPFGVTYFKYTYGSDSQVNKSGTGTPELDEQIAELEKLPTQEEQIQKANELEKEALKQYGIMPYANGPRLVASKKTLANFGATSFAFPAKENIGWAK